MKITIPHCQQCGKQKPSRITDDQCPHCLLALGLSHCDRRLKSVHRETGFASNSAIDGADEGLPADGYFIRQGVLPNFGDYELESEIARGGMGVVYRARQLSLDRVVAVKLIIGGQLATGEAIQRFRFEAQAAARLQHPGIVPIYEIGEYETQHFFSMELIEGASLAQCLGEFCVKDGSPPYVRRQQEQCVAELMSQVAKAIDFAHQRGVLHRDLKPSNILIDEQGIPHLTDFGLAKVTGQEGGGFTLPSAVLGTPGYLPPEQAAGLNEPITTAADVYGIGATFYELLTGTPPFVGPTALATMMMAVQNSPVPPRQLNRSVSRDLETIALKCLEKSPEKRYHSAAAVADELERFLQGKPILARPVTLAEHTWRWCKRNPLAASSLGAAVMIFTAAFVAVSLSSIKARSALHEARQRELAERWALYRSDLSVTADALELYNVTTARNALDAAPPEHRNWEWRYFENHLDSADNVLRGIGNSQRFRLNNDGTRALAFDPSGHPGKPYLFDTRSREAAQAFGPDSGIVDGAFAPDGNLVALVRSGSREVVLWDIHADRMRCLLPQAALALFFCPDGTRLATIGPDRLIRVWDTTTGACKFILSGHENTPSVVAFSSDGRRLASTSNSEQTVRIWDMTDGRLTAVLPGNGQTIAKVFFSPAGDRVFACEFPPGNSVRIWDVDKKICVGELRGNHSELRAYTFSPDGNQLAMGTYDQTVRVWNVSSTMLLATLAGHKGWIDCLAFSPDGKRLASASRDRTVRIWDPASGQSVAVLAGHNGAVDEVRYTPDNASLVTSSEDGTVRIWDARRAELNGALIGHTGSVYDVAFHPDGRRVASASLDGSIRIWDADTGQQLFLQRYPQNNPAVGIAFHPDAHLLASVSRDDCIRIWDVDRNRQVGQIPLPTAATHEVRPAFSRRGDLLACGGGDGAVHLWAVHTPVTGGDAAFSFVDIALLQAQSNVVDVVFGPNATWLASAGTGVDNAVRIWDVSQKKLRLILNPKAGESHALAVSQDGKWLACGCDDGNVHLWNTDTWQQEAVLTQGSGVYGVAFTPDGTRLACGCADNAIRLWDVASHELVCDLQGHQGYVHQLAFSPDGTRLVSGSGDQTVRLWDTLTPAQRRKKATHR